MHAFELGSKRFFPHSLSMKSYCFACGRGIKQTVLHAIFLHLLAPHRLYHGKMHDSKGQGIKLMQVSQIYNNAGTGTSSRAANKYLT